MGPFLHHAALGIAVAALAGASLRLGARAVPSGLGRVVAAAPLAVAAAVLESLVLGLVGWGTSTVALLLAALATWAAARHWLPAPARGPGRELAAWWRGLPANGQWAVAAALGLVGVLGGLDAALPGAGGRRLGLSPAGGAGLAAGRPSGFAASGDPVPPGGELPAHQRGGDGVAARPLARLGGADLLRDRARGAAGRGLVGRPARAAGAPGAEPAGRARRGLPPAGGRAAQRPLHRPARGGVAGVRGCAVRADAAPSRGVRGRPRGRRAGDRHEDDRGARRAARARRDAGVRAPAPGDPGARRRPGGGGRGRRRVVRAQPDRARLGAVAVHLGAVGRPDPRVHAAVRRAVHRPAAGDRRSGAGGLSPGARRAARALPGRGGAGPGAPPARRRARRGRGPGAGAGVVALAVHRPAEQSHPGRVGRVDHPLPAARPRGRGARGGRGRTAAGRAAPDGHRAARRGAGDQRRPAGRHRVPLRARRGDAGRRSPGGCARPGGLARCAVGVAAPGGRPAPAPRAPDRPVAALAAVAVVALTYASSGYVGRHADRDLRNQRELIDWFEDRPGFDEGTRPVHAFPLQIGVLAGDRLTHPLALLQDRGCARLRRRAARAWIVTIPVPATGTPVVDVANRRVAEVDRCLAPRYGPLTILGGYRVYGPRG